MGVASIPDHKDQRTCDEWNDLTTPIRKMEVAKGSQEDFVTVVSVGNQPAPENFVTVLSIGNGREEDEPPPAGLTKSQANVVDGHLEEEVEVFRLPGERLGFGLKFEGGNKTSERVRRLFVQSCAEQSPASRAKCSWGTLGEGDEVLSIDGVPVTHMTRLDCVRRLKESQLVIRLMVRCRGALRPEVVSAERKASPEKSKVPPELPSAPPPVPPRKLRQPRGPADGEANPSPARKTWDRSEGSSKSNSPGSQNGTSNGSKSTSYESCESSPKSVNGGAQESPKGQQAERSPELLKSKEPPEAMVYLDARSQCGSTHGSTSDDTGSSMSTVVDRFSTSDRVSTISTASTASTTSEQQDFDRSSDRDLQLSRAICPFEQLDRELSSSPPDYLLRRLASSEAVTYVESRGEVERITAVVAPNTVLIEETITFQPPLSFQDAPLSYGHEPRPDLFYAADLTADSSTHFRPIKDDAELHDRANGELEELHEELDSSERSRENRAKTPPPLPARNHVNRISVNQTAELSGKEPDRCQEAPVLPPKPLPRRDVKVRRKRPPPPPPPPAIAPRRDIKPLSRQSSSEEENSSPNSADNGSKSEKYSTFRSDSIDEHSNQSPSRTNDNRPAEEAEENKSFEWYEHHEDGENKTNKVLEIIEIRKAKALSPQRNDQTSHEEGHRPNGGASNKINERAHEIPAERVKLELAPSDERNRPETSRPGLSSGYEDPYVCGQEEKSKDPSEKPEKSNRDERTARSEEPDLEAEGCAEQGNEEDETYRSLDEVNDDLKDPTGTMNEEGSIEDDDTSDESDDGEYYWQSNLAPIGEEEETNSLEYTSTDEAVAEPGVHSVENAELTEPRKSEEIEANDDEVDDTGVIKDLPDAEDKTFKGETVNGRMENCGGGQRLPPDGDEFPAAYQEFSNAADNQQFRFVTASRTSTMTANGGLVCAETESFVANDGFKLLATESNVVTTTRTIVHPDARIGLASVENVVPQEANKLGEINGKVAIPSGVVEGNCPEALHREPSVEDRKPYVQDDFVKKHTTVASYASYGNQSSGNGVVVSEKKIEITGYYHKDVPVIEEMQDTEKDTTETPPPLPLTGPPKLEAIALHPKTVPSVEQSQRKFSLNGELWRQDDKSERSVRDKIAMFSSQSSLDTPLFPNTVNVTTTSASRRLSKYKSTEDVCSDEKTPGQKERSSFFAERTQSSFDLTDSSRSFNQDSGRKYGQRSPCLTQASPLSPTTTMHASKPFPVVPRKLVSAVSTPLASFEKPNVVKSQPKNYFSAPSQSQPSSPPNGSNKSPISPAALLKPIAATALTRATSFSGSMPYGQDRASTTNDLPSGSQISRTNSLASTFRKPSEDIRRTSLNQLIEQRRRSISKLRGLVIPEKEAVSIDQPIIDLPEIKSRDSILLHQLPKANIQDKWGSQSSLASNASTASAPLKATTSFKMPAPQIHSKYSPAFKRKSLSVYGSSTTGSSVNGNGVKNAQSIPATSTTTISEPPKSLESICSPTRSDYSFDFVSNASSPEGLRSRPKTVHRKTRMEYDDSDNDSAVSSSQSSISRGFSPPMSPVPSERSTVSSERSYVSTEMNYQRRSLIMDSPTRTYVRESSGMEFNARPTVLAERTYPNERSSSSSSGSNPRSPQPNEVNASNSQIPQRQLRRSNSTETNCSTSSTLTSGSQASAESLSRRVLKPQSVEAINRKNILASARCRSGRDLNGSPLIQRKFTDDSDPSRSAENGGSIHQRTSHKIGDANAKDVKIAYIEVTDPFLDDDSFEKNIEEPKLPPKRSVPLPAARPPKSEMLEPSNDLKMWVRAEAKALEKSANKVGKSITSQETGNFNKTNAVKTRTSTFEEESNSYGSVPQSRSLENDTNSSSSEVLRQRSKATISPKKTAEDPNDLLTILTTKSRSRSAIHVDDGSFGRSKSQTSLEDILSAKPDMKLLRTQSVEGKAEKNGVLPNASGRPNWDSKDIRYGRRNSANSNESWNEEKPFVSKIPTLGRSPLTESGDEMPDIDKPKSAASKIPTAKNLGRRSASVTDMKKAFEKVDGNFAPSNQQAATDTGHNRFPSLDSSVDENVCPMVTDVDADRCCSEQFGSISSLASSTSLISQQELAQLVEEASLEEARGAHDVIVVLLHKENPTGSVGITLAGGADCEVKEITVHRVLAHSVADKDGRVQRGDRILSINGRSTRGLTHRESLAVLKQPRSEIVLVVSRARVEDGCKLRSRTASVETIIEGFESNGVPENTAWGPPSVVAVYKDGAGLGFSLEGGRDSPLGDRPLLIKKIFTGGAAEKTGALRAGDQLLEVNGNDVTRMSRIEAWSLMKKLHDGEVNLLVRHPATKSS